MRKNEKLNDRIGMLVEKDKKLKAGFVLKCKGKNLTLAIRELIDQYAKEYDEMQKK